VNTEQRWRGAVLLLAAMAAGARADDPTPEPAKHRVLVELFTSQG